MFQAKLGDGAIFQVLDRRLVHGLRGIQIAFSHGASGGPDHCAPVSLALEALYPFEDQDFLLASHTGPLHDAIPAISLCFGSRCWLGHVLRRDRRLLPSIFRMPAGLACVDRGCSWRN